LATVGLSTLVIELTLLIPQDEVTQVVAQVTASYGRWTSGVVREVCRRAIGEDGVIDHEAIAAIEMEHVRKLCSLVCECVLTLRFGTVAAYASDGENKT